MGIKQHLKKANKAVNALRKTDENPELEIIVLIGQLLIDRCMSVMQRAITYTHHHNRHGCHG